MRLAPSKAHIWGRPDGCPAYPAMAAKYRTDTVESADMAEGTAAHHMAAAMIEDLRHGRSVQPFEALDGKEAPNGVKLTRGIYDSASYYAGYCAGLMRQCRSFGGDSCRAEAALTATRIDPECQGRCDFYCLAADKSVLHVVEYKNGRRWVDAIENVQLICYAGALIDALGVDDQATRLALHVVQPNALSADRVDPWYLDRAADIRGRINVLHNCAQRAQQPDAPCKAGAHCYGCPARWDCNAAISATVAVYQDVVSTRTSGMSTAQLVALYEMAQHGKSLLDSIVEAVRAELTYRIREGEAIPGYTLKDSFGRTTWNAGQEQQTRGIAEALGIDITERKLKTPAAAIRAGMPGDIVAALTHRPRLGVTLKKVSQREIRKAFT